MARSLSASTSAHVFTKREGRTSTSIFGRRKCKLARNLKDSPTSSCFAAACARWRAEILLLNTVKSPHTCPFSLQIATQSCRCHLRSYRFGIRLKISPKAQRVRRLHQFVLWLSRSWVLLAHLAEHLSVVQGISMSMQLSDVSIPQGCTKTLCVKAMLL